MIPRTPKNARTLLCHLHSSASKVSGAKRRTLPFSLGLAFASLVALAASTAHAVNDAWATTPPGNTFTGNNWTTGATTPGAATGTIASGDTLFFGATNTATLLNDEAAGFNIGSMTFNAAAPAYTINGTNQNNLAGNIVNNSAATQTINVPLALTANRSTTGNMTYGGVISGAFALSFRGVGATTTLTNANTFVGGISEILDGSTLALNFAANVTQNNIFTATQALGIGTSVAGTAQSNALTITGSATQANAQTFGATAIRNMSRINLTAGAGQTLSVTFGTLTGNNANGGAANFNIGNNVTVNLTAVAIAPSASGVVLGNGNYALGTVNENTWAATTATTTTAGTLTGFTGYTVDSVAATNDSDIQTNNLTITANQRTLRFNTAGVSTLNVSGTRQVTNGGVLMTANTNTNLTITDGGTATNLVQGVSNRGLYVYQYNSNNSLTIDASITNSGTTAGLVKLGAGALVLNKANTYGGSTLVQEGALVVNGGVAGTSSGTGTGPTFATAAGTRLAGIGVIAPGTGNPGAGANTANITIGGIVAPGTGVGAVATIGNGSIGMLTFNLSGSNQTAPVAGVMNIASTASFQFDLGTGGGTLANPGTSDRIMILGSANNTSGVDVAFNGNTLNFLGGGQNGVYKLFDVDANTTTSGQGGLVVTNLAAGLTGTISIGDGTNGDQGDIYLTVVPEPSAWAMTAAGGIGLLLVARRRRASMI